MTIREKMKIIFSDIWQFLGPFVRLFASEAGRTLAKVALRVVVDISKDTSLVTSDDRRKAAFKGIVEELKGYGLSLSTSVINAAIEAAVCRLKDKGAD